MRTLDAGADKPLPFLTNTDEENPALGVRGYRTALRSPVHVGDTVVAGEKVDVVFIGSCTNSRLTDLRAAASILAGRNVAPGTRVLIVPGSELTRRQAEAEGLEAHRMAVAYRLESLEP